MAGSASSEGGDWQTPHPVAYRTKVLRRGAGSEMNSAPPSYRRCAEIISSILFAIACISACVGGSLRVPLKGAMRWHSVRVREGGGNRAGPQETIPSRIACSPAHATYIFAHATWRPAPATSRPAPVAFRPELVASRPELVAFRQNLLRPDQNSPRSDQNLLRPDQNLSRQTRTCRVPTRTCHVLTRICKIPTPPRSFAGIFGHFEHPPPRYPFSQPKRHFYPFSSSACLPRLRPHLQRLHEGRGNHVRVRF